MDIDTGNTLIDKGKRKMGEDVIMTDLQTTSSKKSREMKNLLVKVKEYATPTITTEDGKVIDTEKTIREHYADLAAASKIKRNQVREKLRTEHPPQMPTTLAKESQMMKVVVIQPPIKGQSTNKEITEIELNMGQFSIVDKVDLFK